MKRFVLFLLLAAFCFPAKGQDGSETVPKTRYFDKVGGRGKIEDRINHFGKGTFVEAVPLDNPSTDTLKIWVQGVRLRKQPPNRDSAATADLVVWCFPQHYQSDKHIFPGAEGVVRFREQNGRLAVIADGVYNAYVTGPR